jgi:hypothetical protein
MQEAELVMLRTVRASVEALKQMLTAIRDVSVLCKPNSPLWSRIRLHRISG